MGAYVSLQRKLSPALLLLCCPSLVAPARSGERCRCRRFYSLRHSLIAALLLPLLSSLVLPLAQAYGRGMGACIRCSAHSSLPCRCLCCPPWCCPWLTCAVEVWALTFPLNVRLSLPCRCLCHPPRCAGRGPGCKGGVEKQGQGLGRGAVHGAVTGVWRAVQVWPVFGLPLLGKAID